MWQYDKINSGKKLQIASLLIVTTGIVFRFYHQFINWTYSSDAVLLGLDILNNDYPDLLKPFESFQSAPPLFLLLQKLFSEMPPSYIALKILGFLSSAVGLIYFKKLIERRGISNITIALLLIFTFNPFILYQSLTLKQYTFDLTFGLLAVYYFEKRRSFTITFLFFATGCLLSNAALFFTSAFILNIFFRNYSADSKVNITNYLNANLKEALPFILAPLAYIIFFIWFIVQPGAGEAKNFMTTYWQPWFVPLNKNIFWWLGVQAYRMMFYFYSTYFFLGLILLTGFLAGCCLVWKRGNRENLFFIRIYLLTVSVHLLLSVFQLYPFSDRLYLYMAPVVLYLGVYGLFGLLQNLGLRRRYAHLSLLMVTFLLISFNFTYMPYKENDVPALSKGLRSYDNHRIFRTSRANHHLNQWVSFTQYPGLSDGFLKSENRILFDSIRKNDLVISRIYRKFGHKVRTSKIENSLKVVLAKRKTKRVISVKGYNVYLILD